MPASSQLSRLGNADMTPCAVGVRTLRAVSAAGPCATGHEHCEQATTNGHDAECNLLHDVPSQVHTPPPYSATAGIMQGTGAANHCAPDQFAESALTTTLRGLCGRTERWIGGAG